MMNGYNGWNGYENGWDGGMSYTHPFIGTDAMAFLLPMLFFCLAIALALVAFQIWLYYRIFNKAGYNGWWSLLALIPGVGTLVVMLVLAFDNWPIHRGEVGGSPMSSPAPVAPAVNVAAQASAYNPTPASVYSPAPAAPVVVPAAPAEPPVPVVAPVPVEPTVTDAPKSESAE